jgi:hypothetical protein
VEKVLPRLLAAVDDPHFKVSSVMLKSCCSLTGSCWLQHLCGVDLLVAAVYVNLHALLTCLVIST